MMNDPITLYKLMCLYMMHRVNFPLTGNQISDFFLGHEYTNFFTLQQVLNDLTESSLIDAESIHNTTRYQITPDGVQTLEFFSNNIPVSIVDDMDDYLRENQFKMRNESSTTADYYQSTARDYICHFEVREGKSSIITLELAVPDEKQAAHMCSKWKDKSSDIYSHIIKSLISEDE